MLQTLIRNAYRSRCVNFCYIRCLVQASELDFRAWEGGGGVSSQDARKRLHDRGIQIHVIKARTGKHTKDAERALRKIVYKRAKTFNHGSDEVNSKIFTWYQSILSRLHENNRPSSAASFCPSAGTRGRSGSELMQPPPPKPSRGRQVDPHRLSLSDSSPGKKETASSNFQTSGQGLE